ncbi:Hypothetical predicted protein [Olea europaea subsp. europaea]|uniref:DUF1985 domain-containing protein n=1 Tax=Olea europaea subsp. europaea TaxID=158383 RepID=A0A8S0TC16_OLEEU|nr:Hypothetical predicted protein [Olea europaea subsp. europaea]
MKFQFWVPENVWLLARISQQSNLKYIKMVMDNLDDRLRADFRNSCIGFLANVPEIQFSTQLIQALVCQGICCDKSHELWFNVQGHLTEFGLQEYVIVTGLHAGSFPEGDRYTKALEKRRLKEKYFKSLEKISCAQLEKAFVRASTPRADRYKLGLALIVEGVITAPDNNVSIDEDTPSLVDDLELFFSLPLGQSGIWAYEVVPELDERFSQRLHVHATLRPTEAKFDLPYIASLVPFPNCPVQFLDDLARSVVGPQFHEAAPTNGGHDGSAVGDDHDDESGAETEDNEKSTSDDRQTPEGNGNDGSKANESKDSSRDTSSETSAGDTEDGENASGRQSGALPNPMGAPSTSGLQASRGGSTVMREDVEGMLLDQRILIEMRLWTPKLEIIQHVTEEFARLRDFISSLMPTSGGTSTSVVAPVVNEPNIWDDPHEDGESSDERSPQDDDHADEGEMQEAKDEEGKDKQSPHDDDHAEEGDMQEVNNSGETISMLPRDDNEDGQSTQEVTEVDGRKHIQSEG